MQISDLPIEGLKLITLKHYLDSRGFFVERYNAERFSEIGLGLNFVQDNFSRSAPKVLRGLHYQHAPAQGKLVGCLNGSIYDVVVDLRTDSKTFGKHFGIELSGESGKLLWIPAGFAHGFCALGETPADVMYKVTAIYNPTGETGLRWNDPAIGIQWPVKDPILSPKDAEAPDFASYKGSELATRNWWK